MYFCTKNDGIEVNNGQEDRQQMIFRYVPAELDKSKH